MRAGFDVTAFEIAPTRRRFASDKMGVKVITALKGLTPSFDCFFSAHVLEHVPSPSAAIQSGLRILKPGGIFVCFTPNGSASYRAVAPTWSTIWGGPHPQLIDELFLDRIFTNYPRCIGSFPTSAPRFGSQIHMMYLDNLAGSELFFAARKS
jgi:SAM-dependent methyltransferase